MPSHTALWLIAGAGLCLTELFFPTAFVVLMMGISSLVVGLVSIVLPHLGLQVAIWMVLSVILVILSRRLVPSGRHPKIRDAVIGETLTEIPPGKTGRILYEGNSWQARCDDNLCSIAPHERVYIVRREGTTLIVMPENLLNS